MPSSPSRLLVADDQRDVLEALRLLLKAEGYLIDLVESPAAVLAALGERDYDVVLIDLNYTRDTTSGEEGLELLRRIHDADTSMPVVVMTAWGSVHLAVEAMRRGARAADVLRLILLPSARIVGVGLVAGSLCTAVFDRLFTTTALRLTDAAIMGPTLMAMAVVALAASVVPALAAARVDPVTVLRED